MGFTILLFSKKFCFLRKYPRPLGYFRIYSLNYTEKLFEKFVDFGRFTNQTTCDSMILLQQNYHRWCKNERKDYGLWIWANVV